MIGQVNLLSFESKSKCCGCRACENICPVQAISITEDAEGFAYPVIDHDICLDCGICDKICPIINAKKNPQNEYVKACYSKDVIIRNDASSGGIFELLARKVIADGGVVFGAAFDENLTLKHTYVNNLQDLKRLCKSKYVQSDTKGIFIKVKELISDNIKVMFVGTPCQISALNNYLGDLSDQLLTVDFICHGVPSDRMFKSYVETEEKKHRGKMTDFSFRIKDGKVKHVHGYSYVIERNRRQQTYTGMFFDNPYYLGFKKYLFLRPSCYSCIYCTPERVSDITLADFWGIEDYLPDVDFNKGVSMILVNSEKGQTYLSAIGDDIDSYEFGIDIAIQNNQCLSVPTKLPPNREKLMQDYQSMSFDDFAERHIISKKRMVYKIFYMLPLFIRKRFVKIFKGMGYV